MNDKGCVIMTDSRYMGGMMKTVQQSAEEVTLLVVGSRALAEQAAVLGANEVVLCEIGEMTPPESVLDDVVAYVQCNSFGIIMTNDAPSSRVLLASVAAALDASVLGNVIGTSAVENGYSITRFAAGGIAIEHIRVDGSLAAIYGGTDIDLEEASSTSINELDSHPSSIRIVDSMLPASDAVNLSEAMRILGVGRGVRLKDDLQEIEELAYALGASMACTLPLSEDSHWYPAEQVLGSSHNQASPELYIALGISGSPNHMSGVKDSKIVVAVNNDPDAMIFRRCNYGIVCDLYQFVSAFKNVLTA